MNVWIFSAGIIGIVTALIHIFAGQVDPVRPFLKLEFHDGRKATLLACWHMVSVMLFFSSLVFIYIGWYSLETIYLTIIGLSASYLIFSMVFVIVGWWFFGVKVFVKVPQWLLMLPIGCLSLYGSIYA